MQTNKTLFVCTLSGQNFYKMYSLIKSDVTINWKEYIYIVPLILISIECKPNTLLAKNAKSWHYINFTQEQKLR